MTGFGDDFSEKAPKAWYMKEKIDKFDFLLIKKLLLCNGHCSENQVSQKLRGKSLQNTYLIKDWYPNM